MSPKNKIVLTIAGILGITLTIGASRSCKVDVGGEVYVGPKLTDASTERTRDSALVERAGDGASALRDGASAASPRQITILNGCKDSVWMASQPNAGVTTNLPALVQVDPGKTAIYDIPTDGWAGRFWPKVGCDAKGWNCKSGDSIPPCGSADAGTGPCEPPADTKIEFFFAKAGDSKRSYYDISLVDGYSLPFMINPSTSDATCVPTLCDLSLDKCPTDEKIGSTKLGDLQVKVGGEIAQCLSPCKKWNYPAPYGHGKPETTKPGPALCCPSPVTPEQCNANFGVRSTKYAKLVHASCRSAYAFSYDDAAGSHDCPNPTSFRVVLCAEPAAK